MSRRTLGSIKTLAVPSQTEAVAGTAIIKRVWTAQRVKQASVGVLQSEVATSGSAISLSTTVPSWVGRITLLFEDVSTDGTEELLLQIGPSGGVETTGYVGMAMIVIAASTVTDNSTSGFIITGQTVNTHVLNGKVVLDLKDSTNNTWVSSGNLGTVPGTVAMHVSAGVKPLAAILTQITITTTGTPDNFDGGSIALVYE